LEKDLIELSSLISLEQSGKDEVQWGSHPADLHNKFIGCNQQGSLALPCTLFLLNKLPYSFSYRSKVQYKYWGVRYLLYRNCRSYINYLAADLRSFFEHIPGSLVI
jgi:hypothetical protein